MKSYDQSCGVQKFTAPVGDVVAGLPYKIGSLVVIAAYDAVAGDPFEGATMGVYAGVKVAQQAWTEGLKIYWDATARKFTATVGSNTLVGVSIEVTPLSIDLATSAAVPGDIANTADEVLEIVQFGNLAGDTVSIKVNRETTIVLTEGVDFDAETDNVVTATNLAAAINALVRAHCTAVRTLAMVSNDADMTVLANAVTIGAFGGIAGKTLTVTVHGQATVLTEGVEFNAAVSNDQTATNLAVAINAIPGLAAAAVGAVVTVLLPSLRVVADSPLPGLVRLDGAAR